MDSSIETCADYASKVLQDRAIKWSTARNYWQSINVLGLADLPIDQLTVALVNDRLQRVLTASTRRKHIMNIKAVFGLGIKIPKESMRLLTLPPLETLHAAIEPNTYAMWGFSMLYAGMRPGESCIKQQQSGRVLHIDRQLTPHGIVTSSKTTGDVVVPEWFADRYSTFSPATANNTVYKGLSKALRAVGVLPKDLRHAFATNLVRAGAQPEVLRRQMRHSDVTVSLRYYVHTTQDDITRAMDRFGNV